MKLTMMGPAGWGFLDELEKAEIPFSVAPLIRPRPGTLMNLELGQTVEIALSSASTLIALASLILAWNQRDKSNAVHAITIEKKVVYITRELPSGEVEKILEQTESINIFGHH